MFCEKCNAPQKYQSKMIMIVEVEYGKDVTHRGYPAWGNNFICLECFGKDPRNLAVQCSMCKELVDPGPTSKCYKCNKIFCSNDSKHCEWCPYTYCIPCYQAQLCFCKSECLTKLKPDHSHKRNFDCCFQCRGDIHHDPFSVKIRGNVLAAKCEPMTYNYCCKCRLLPEVKALPVLTLDENPHTWPNTHLLCKCGEQVCALSGQLKSGYAEVVVCPGGTGAFLWDNCSHYGMETSSSVDLEPSRWGLSWKDNREIKKLADAASGNHCDNENCNAFTEEIFNRWKINAKVAKKAALSYDKREQWQESKLVNPVDEDNAHHEAYITPKFIDHIVSLYSNWSFKARLLEELVHKNKLFFKNYVRWYHRLHKVLVESESNCAMCPKICIMEKRLCCNCMDGFVAPSSTIINSLNSIFIPPLISTIWNYYNCSVSISYMKVHRDRCSECFKFLCEYHGKLKKGWGVCVACVNKKN